MRTAIACQPSFAGGKRQREDSTLRQAGKVETIWPGASALGSRPQDSTSRRDATMSHSYSSHRVHVIFSLPAPMIRLRSLDGGRSHDHVPALVILPPTLRLASSPILKKAVPPRGSMNRREHLPGRRATAPSALALRRQQTSRTTPPEESFLKRSSWSSRRGTGCPPNQLTFQDSCAVPPGLVLPPSGATGVCR